MSRWKKWWYQSATGEFVFQHYRVSDPASPRGKRFGYRVPTAIVDKQVQGWKWFKPSGADALLYKLPLVLAHPDRWILVTEGEADADAALSRGFLATSHHGGAGKFTVAQAESLVRHRGRIALVADNDPAGALDVCVRFDRLRDAGIPASRLRVCEVAPTHPGADLRDHLDAGFRLRDLKRADLGRLRELRDMAAEAKPSPGTGSWPDDLTPEERDQIKNWRPQVVRRKR